MVRIDAGYYSTCVLTDSAGVRCWGENIDGEGVLGYAMKENVGDDELPSVMGDVSLGEAALNVSVDSRRACAALESGVVRCWGGNILGLTGPHLGDDEKPDSVGPIDWFTKPPVSVTSGGYYHCALDSAGEIECSLPIPKLAGPVASVASGSRHACVVLVDGRVQCWGNISVGALGYPGVNFIFGPDIEEYDLGIVDVGQPVVQVVAGDWHTCALLKSGGVRCWGANWSAELGYGTGLGDACGVYFGHEGPECDRRPDCCVGDDEPPSAWPPIDLGEGRVVRLDAGARHTCAVMESGAIRCWGFNRTGQLGYGNTEDIGDDEPAGAGGDVSLDHAFVDVAAGGRHTCGLTDEGGVYCWGYNGTRGHLGQGVSKPGCVDDEGFAYCALPECCLGDDEPIDSFPPVRVF